MMNEMLIVAAALTFAASFVYAQRLRHDRLLRHREMLHKERLAAIEKGLELPPLAGANPEDARMPAQSALAAGLVLLLAGIGLTVALRFVPSTGNDGGGLHTLASFGLIPAFAGAGLLLFSWMSRTSES
jgi:hypothetical protein